MLFDISVILIARDEGRMTGKRQDIAAPLVKAANSNFAEFIYMAIHQWR